MPRPAIFISAVSGKLNGARLLMASTLRFLGYEAVWQDDFGAEQGDVRETLRRKIDDCAAVIQLVGRCYGSEPPAPDEQFGRVSFTQYEALYARQRGKTVWYLFLDDSFPQDPFQPEPDELTRLQASYAARVRDDHPTSRTLRDISAVIVTLHELGPNTGDLESKLATLAGTAGGAEQHELQSILMDVLPEDLEAPTGAPPAPPPPQSVFDEDVQFSVYRPQAMALTQWYTWLAFAHRGPGAPDEPDYAEEVENQARAVLGAKFEDYATGRQESGAALPRESTISIVPSVDGLEFNPAQRSFVWQEPVHREEFRARALVPAPNGIHRGRITFYLGALVVAEVNVKVTSTTTDPAGPLRETGGALAADRARAYRQIFASYSRRDTAMVEHFEKLVASFGDRYLRDVHTLRAGEEWNPGLERMIRDANVFQLFWSSNSMRSRYVRQEWEYALSLGRPHFVRPTYWEKPIPSDPAANLPPDELRRLHFQHLPIDLSAQAKTSVDVKIGVAEPVLLPRAEDNVKTVALAPVPVPRAKSDVRTDACEPVALPSSSAGVKTGAFPPVPQPAPGAGVKSGARTALQDPRHGFEFNAPMPAPPKSLRTERHRGRFLFFVLLCAFAAIVYGAYLIFKFRTLNHP